MGNIFRDKVLFVVFEQVKIIRVSLTIPMKRHLLTVIKILQFTVNFLIKEQYKGVVKIV